MKQLGLGFQLFQNDQGDRLPPAAFRTGDYQYQLTWDDYIHRAIGGKASEADLLVGVTAAENCPKILQCPADRNRISIPWSQFGQRRTYSMNGANLISEGPLPTPLHGVGVYITGRSGALPPWDSTGYKGDLVAAPSDTLLLVEQPNGRNVAGNDWPSFSVGPTEGSGNPGGFSGDCFQISASQYSYGNAAYGLHKGRFNYLFHDGHVSIHRITDTIGTGTAGQTRIAIEAVGSPTPSAPAPPTPRAACGRSRRKIELDWKRDQPMPDPPRNEPLDVDVAGGTSLMVKNCTLTHFWLRFSEENA